MRWTIFFICLTSAISAYFAALGISAWPAALKRWRKGCRNRQERTGSWQSESRRRWIWPSLSRQVLRLCRIRLRRKAWGYSKHPVEKIGQVQGNLTQKNQDAASSSQGWKKDAVLDVGTRKLIATEEDQVHLNFSWRFSEQEETRRFRKLRNRRQWQILATQSPFFNKLRAAHGEGFLDRETKIWSQPDGSNEEPR